MKNRALEQIRANVAERISTAPSKQPNMRANRSARIGNRHPT
ncbi:hypothetical protein [Paenibacillus agaridevorans]|nr:hypothetical protein [Paenibacillus agaridevorans]